MLHKISKIRIKWSFGKNMENKIKGLKLDLQMGNIK